MIPKLPVRARGLLQLTGRVGHRPHTLGEASKGRGGGRVTALGVTTPANPSNSETERVGGEGAADKKGEKVCEGANFYAGPAPAFGLVRTVTRGRGSGCAPVCCSRGALLGCRLPLPLPLAPSQELISAWWRQMASPAQCHRWRSAGVFRRKIEQSRHNDVLGAVRAYQTFLRLPDYLFASL